MKVQILRGDGWYRENVGGIFEVEEETTYFRTSNGGRRVKHYICTETEQEGSWIKYKLIQCSHAKKMK